jgi:P-type E1-E2 ATPase
MGFNGWSRTRVLRLAACLEEHYPHPVARAVVNAASEANLKHRERHADVEYIVAHGLASSVGGVRVVIGSRHFVVEDEHVEVLPEVRQRIMDEMGGLSVLYLAYDGQLVGALGIEDPLKPGAAEAVADLQRLGFRHVIMLTGDNLAAARRVAHAAGITEFQANMLPEDKHAFVERLQREGRHVVMVGDGVNDSPALSAADVGVAMAAGTAIAREVADITLTDSDLQSLARLRRISQGLDRRFDQSFRTIMGFNSLLLALGIAGVITPQTSSLLHNGSTVLLGASATRSYL